GGFGTGGAVFAGSQTFGHYVTEVLVNDEHLGEINPVRGVGASRDHELYGGLRRQRAGIADVEDRFDFFAAAKIAGVRAVEDNLRNGPKNAEVIPEVDEVLHDDVGARDD